LCYKLHLDAIWFNYMHFVNSETGTRGTEVVSSHAMICMGPSCLGGDQLDLRRKVGLPAEPRPSGAGRTPQAGR
jgi:hypothetical protein